MKVWLFEVTMNIGLAGDPVSDNVNIGFGLFGHGKIMRGQLRIQFISTCHFPGSHIRHIQSRKKVTKKFELWMVAEPLFLHQLTKKGRLDVYAAQDVKRLQYIDEKWCNRRAKYQVMVKWWIDIFNLKNQNQALFVGGKDLCGPVTNTLEEMASTSNWGVEGSLMGGIILKFARIGHWPLHPSKSNTASPYKLHSSTQLLLFTFIHSIAVKK